MTIGAPQLCSKPKCGQPAVNVGKGKKRRCEEHWNCCSYTSNCKRKCISNTIRKCEVHQMQYVKTQSAKTQKSLSSHLLVNRKIEELDSSSPGGSKPLLSSSVPSNERCNVQIELTSRSNIGPEALTGVSLQIPEGNNLESQDSFENEMKRDMITPQIVAQSISNLANDSKAAKSSNRNESNNDSPDASCSRSVSGSGSVDQVFKPVHIFDTREGMDLSNGIDCNSSDFAALLEDYDETTMDLDEVQQITAELETEEPETYEKFPSQWKLHRDRQEWESIQESNDSQEDCDQPLNLEESHDRPEMDLLPEKMDLLPEKNDFQVDWTEPLDIADLVQEFTTRRSISLLNFCFRVVLGCSDILLNIDNYRGSYVYLMRRLFALSDMPDVNKQWLQFHTLVDMRFRNMSKKVQDLYLVWSTEQQPQDHNCQFAALLTKSRNGSLEIKDLDQHLVLCWSYQCPNKHEIWELATGIVEIIFQKPLPDGTQGKLFGAFQSSVYLLCHCICVLTQYGRLRLKCFRLASLVDKVSTLEYLVPFMEINPELCLELEFCKSMLDWQFKTFTMSPAICMRNILHAHAKLKDFRHTIFHSAYLILARHWITSTSRRSCINLFSSPYKINQFTMVRFFSLDATTLETIRTRCQQVMDESVNPTAEMPPDLVNLVHSALRKFISTTNHIKIIYGESYVRRKSKDDKPMSKKGRAKKNPWWHCDSIELIKMKRPVEKLPFWTVWICLESSHTGGSDFRVGIKEGRTYPGNCYFFRHDVGHGGEEPSNQPKRLSCDLRFWIADDN